MFVDTDGRLYGFPRGVFDSRPALDNEIKENMVGIIAWLKILAASSVK